MKKLLGIRKKAELDSKKADFGNASIRPSPIAPCVPADPTRALYAQSVGVVWVSLPTAL